MAVYICIYLFKRMKDIRILEKYKVRGLSTAYVYV